MPDMKKLADSLPEGVEPDEVIQMVKDAGYTVEPNPDFVAVTVSSADYKPGEEEEKDEDDKGVQEKDEDEKDEKSDDDGPEVGSEGFNKGSHGDRLKAIRKMMQGS